MMTGTEHELLRLKTEASQLSSGGLALTPEPLTKLAVPPKMGMMAL